LIQQSIKWSSRPIPFSIHVEQCPQRYLCVAILFSSFIFFCKKCTLDGQPDSEYLKKKKKKKEEGGEESGKEEEEEDEEEVQHMEP